MNHFLKQGKIIALNIFISLFFLVACNPKPKDVKSGLPMVLFKISSDENSLDSSGNKGLAIRFYENGTYSHFGYNFFAYGHWSWDSIKKVVTLNPSISKDSIYTHQFKVERRTKEGFAIRKIRILNGKSLIERDESTAIGFNISKSKDPFSKEMNTWRIKPVKSESPQQIRERTFKYLEFLQAYYDFINKNKVNFFTYGWYATPIQMHYGNGIRMAYNNELTDWYACFYNIDEGNEGYKLIAAAMQKAELKETESKAERNTDFLKQLIDAL